MAGFVENGINLLLQQVSLQGAEELFGLRQGQPEMLDALAVFVERDHVGDSLFLTLIAAYDELKFDTHTGASPGSSGRGMIQAIVPELIHNPQHLPALVLSMLTLVCHFKKVMHREWAYFQARLAFTMALFNILVQWHGFQPYASGFVPLSIAEFSL